MLTPQRIAIYVREACARVLVLLIHPFGLGRSGRADDDQVARVPQPLIDDLAQVGGCWEFLPVPKHGKQTLGHRSVECVARDDGLGYAVPLNAAVQPMPPFFVLMRIADEGLVFVMLRGFGHAGRILMSARLYKHIWREGIRLERSVTRWIILCFYHDMPSGRPDVEVPSLRCGNL